VAPEGMEVQEEAANFKLFHVSYILDLFYKKVIFFK